MSPEATDPGRQPNGGRDRAGGGNDSWDRKQWFRHTVMRLLDCLYGTALRLTGDRIQAEELVAETVTRARAGLKDQLQDTARLEGWLLHVLCSTFIRNLQQPRRPKAPRGGPGGQPENADHHTDEHPPLLRERSTPSAQRQETRADRFPDTLRRDEVAGAVDALPEDERVVVVLVDIQGYRRAEAAAMLQAAADPVRARLDRGRARLREALCQLADDTGRSGPAPP